jgi:DNA transposition AAA+ family ATPase
MTVAKAEINVLDVLVRVRAEIDRREMTQGQAAKEMGVSPTTLTQLLNDTYGADPKTQIAKLEKWLIAQAEAQAQAAKLPTLPDYVQTETADRINATLGYGHLAGDLVLIYGGAGLGKTTAIREFKRRYPNVWVATMNPTTASPVTCLEEVYLALGLKVAWTGGAARMQREICRKVQGAAGLLIIDEAQHLSVNALEALRSIHDTTGVGLALVGNETVYSRMAGGNRAAYLDRLSSRIGKKLKLAKPAKSDIERICQHFEVTDKASLSLMLDLGNRGGALRSIVKVLRLASMMAGGSSPTASDIKAAWADLNI